MSKSNSSLPSLLRIALGPHVALPDTSGEVPASLSPRVRCGLYAFPWPDAIVGLGRRHVGPFDMCACGGWSWVRYGNMVLCLRCALGAAGARTRPAEGPRPSLRLEVAK